MCPKLLDIFCEPISLRAATCERNGFHIRCCKFPCTIHERILSQHRFSIFCRKMMQRGKNFSFISILSGRSGTSLKTYAIRGEHRSVDAHHCSLSRKERTLDIFCSSFGRTNEGEALQMLLEMMKNFFFSGSTFSHRADFIERQSCFDPPRTFRMFTCIGEMLSQLF